MIIKVESKDADPGVLVGSEVGSGFDLKNIDYIRSSKLCLIWIRFFFEDRISLMSSWIRIPGWKTQILPTSDLHWLIWLNPPQFGNYMTEIEKQLYKGLVLYVQEVFANFIW